MILISLVLLAYPILSIPSIMRSKQKNGKYFPESRFFMSKRIGYGIGINMHNRFGFFTLLAIGGVFIFFALWL